MKHFFSVLFLFIFGLNETNAQIGIEKKSVYFQCPPCNMECDTIHFSKPGFCPNCGMKLFASFLGNENKQGEHAEVIKKKVAVIIFPGVEIIDFTGPWEVFGAAGMEVYSVSLNDLPVETNMGLKIKPDYTFKNAPQPDIILIPGGNIDPSNITVTDWILEMSHKAEHTMSVCNGAFYLGSMGLLDNQKATTVFPAIENLKHIAPEAIVSDSVRYTDNGKILTSAGLSSGIDAAFHLVSVYLGKGQAKKIAVQLEYDWNEKKQFVRGKLADKYVLDIIHVLTPFDYELKIYDGDEKNWQTEVLVKDQIEIEDLRNLIDIQLETATGWQKTEKENIWAKKNNSKTWTSILEIQKVGINQINIKFKVFQD
jgi:putative intracellular protease/amidase